MTDKTIRDRAQERIKKCLDRGMDPERIALAAADHKASHGHLSETEAAIDDAVVEILTSNQEA